MESKAHWECVYQTHAADEVSWYQPRPERSLALIRSLQLGLNAQVIDVGGGTSTLVDELLHERFQRLTVLDISAQALGLAQTRLGELADKITWLEADITEIQLPSQHYDLWHDRAVFHFLTTPEQRAHYVEAVKTALKPNGYIIVATFAPNGPARCSGLAVRRYQPDELHGEFGSCFQPLHSTYEAHVTPTGATQHFVYCCCRATSL